ncbi:MAG: sugar phosphate isomerase/epimerase [Clostridia bacterium]|nr:sugar phosphate isomerase/epimerase [Clostridia bacterium]
MEIGISTASFFGRQLTEDTFDIIKELGFATCEVFLTTFSEYRESFAKLVNERKNGLNIYSIHTLNQQFEPELYNMMPRTREDCESIFKQAARAAGILGAKYYTFHGPARLRGRNYVFDYQRLGTRTEELCALLKSESGCCELSYENVSWAFFYQPEFFAKLREISPSIKACLDIKQAMQSGLHALDFLECMKGRLVNVHLCDYDELGQLSVPGKGIFDFTELFVRLADIGYDGPLMMELYSKNYNNYEDIREGREYLLECLEKARQKLLL